MSGLDLITYRLRELTRMVKLQAARDLCASEMLLMCQRMIPLETESALDGDRMRCCTACGGRPVSWTVIQLMFDIQRQAHACNGWCRLVWRQLFWQRIFWHQPQIVQKIRNAKTNKMQLSGVSSSAIPQFILGHALMAHAERMKTREPRQLQPVY
jgi:hypothetical protein